jgi:hypothetical protein
MRGTAWRNRDGRWPAALRLGAPFFVLALVTGGLAAHPARTPIPAAVPHPPPPQADNPEWRGDFTFTRIRYGASSMRRFGGSAWAHDYPDADRNLQVILREMTSMRPNADGTNVFDLEDAEIFRNPVLYLSEPGFWGITDEGARNLREYLLRGGLIIFDDFEAEQWYNFESQLKRAMPEYELIEIEGDHPVFQSFFRVVDIYVPHPLVRVTPRY